MYKSFFKVHLYASLIICPFLLVFAITGSLIAFEPEIDHLTHANLSYVEPGQTPLSLALIGNNIRKSFPRDTISGYGLSTSPNISYQIYLNDKTVYVDQYTGKILGTMAGPDFWQTAQGAIHTLHLRLAIPGKTGKSIMSWSALVLLLILPSGLFLWWKQKRITVRKGISPRLVWFDIHSMVGIFSFVLLMLLALTGVMIGFEDTTTRLLYKLTSSQPNLIPDFKSTEQTNTTAISPDSALQIARSALPGSMPFDVNVPIQNQLYMIRSRYPEDRTPGGRSRVVIDPHHGKVLYKEGSRTAPAGTRLKNLNRAIHTGDIFGVTTKILMSLASLALAAQIVSGIRMWWLRKRRQQRAESNQLAH